MTASPEQAALLADPATSAATLQSLAAADPELWPAIAAHPNVYPDLLTWMHENGLAQTPLADETAPDVVGDPLPEEPAAEAEEAEPDAEPEPEAPEREVGHPHEPIPTEARTAELPPAYQSTPAGPASDPFVWRAWVSDHRKILIAVGGGVAVAVLVLVLVVNLIVLPQQVAAKAAAEAAAALETAIDDFGDAAQACEDVNRTYERVLQNAEAKTTVDPTTLADPVILDDLRTSIDDAEGLEPCVSPTVAEETYEIEEQTRLVLNDVRRIDVVVDSVNSAMNAVDRSIALQQQAAADAAAAAAAAAEAAERAARTWTMSDPQGYGFTATLDIGAPTTTYSGSTGSLTESGISYELGDACGFDPAVDIAVPVTLRVTATTQGFDTDVSALVTVTQSGRVATPHEIVVEGYFSDGPACQTPTYGSTILNGVHWNEPLETGASATHTFMVIIREWKTPATPNGDSAFFDNVSMRVSGGQSSTYGTSSSQQLFLSGRVK